ncbi:MAG TPA: hypothetical protein VL752_18080 [Acidisoma sp.]|uniref:hypothetical protein n=1 Tax=Acidisoma sp. TaxID=1872115 RepID=UPI002B7DCE72|nr:hypothetical protein [Acidisoma sp.]HTI02861.1 hypothetical protein [Acidisoma sp.]
MRISRDKAQVANIELAADEIEASLHNRRKELTAIIQAALKVGADYPARESGRKALAELMKMEPDLQPNPSGVGIAASGHVMFTAPKRRRMRAAV